MQSTLDRKPVDEDSFLTVIEEDDSGDIKVKASKTPMPLSSHYDVFVNERFQNRIKITALDLIDDEITSIRVRGFSKAAKDKGISFTPGTRLYSTSSIGTGIPVTTPPPAAVTTVCPVDIITTTTISPTSLLTSTTIAPMIFNSFECLDDADNVIFNFTISTIINPEYREHFVDMIATAIGPPISGKNKPKLKVNIVGGPEEDEAERNRNSIREVQTSVNSRLLITNRSSWVPGTDPDPGIARTVYNAVLENTGREDDVWGTGPNTRVYNEREPIDNRLVVSEDAAAGQSHLNIEPILDHPIIYQYYIAWYEAQVPYLVPQSDIIIHVDSFELNGNNPTAVNISIPIGLELRPGACLVPIFTTTTTAP